MTANSFGSRATLRAGETDHVIYRLDAVKGTGSLPFSLKVLLENLLRNEDGRQVTAGPGHRPRAVGSRRRAGTEIQFTPARVILQDLTGVPRWSTWPRCVTRCAARRRPGQDQPADPGRAGHRPLGGRGRVRPPGRLRPSTSTWSSSATGSATAFLRWGQQAFRQFTVVPPGTGIVHQVNLEYLARVVDDAATARAYPDTCVGTDSHTTDGQRARRAGLGRRRHRGRGGHARPADQHADPAGGRASQLTGELPDGTTATDLVLTITEMLRAHGVVGKFVEFYGDGVAAVPLAEPGDDRQHEPGVRLHLRDLPDRRGDADLPAAHRPRRAERVALVEAYAKEQGLWHDPAGHARYTEELALDLSTVVPSLAGPKRPQDRVPLADARSRVSRRARVLRRAARLDDEMAGPPGIRPVRPDREDGDDAPGPVSPGQPPATPSVDSGPGHPRRRHAAVGGPRLRRDRGDHLVHQHLQPVGHGRRRPAGPQRGRARPGRASPG